MVYDTSHNQIILFGGRDQVYYGDTWVLKTSQTAQEGTYTSPDISLPPGFAWDSLTIDKTEPVDTKLTVSILNAETGLYINEFRNIEPRLVTLAGMEANLIKLRCHLEGDGVSSPTLNSWKITWKKKVQQPEYLGGIPLNIPITEDTPEPAILDLSDYFDETRNGDFTYQIESITDNENIRVEINNSFIDVTYLKDNWTGKTDLIVNCTNTYGESVSSDKFSIVVQRVDDPPVWSSKLPPISIDEDRAYTSTPSLTFRIFSICHFPGKNQNEVFLVRNDLCQ